MRGSSGYSTNHRDGSRGGPRGPSSYQSNESRGNSNNQSSFKNRGRGRRRGRANHPYRKNSQDDRPYSNQLNNQNNNRSQSQSLNRGEQNYEQSTNSYDNHHNKDQDDNGPYEFENNSESCDDQVCLHCLINDPNCPHSREMENMKFKIDHLNKLLRSEQTSKQNSVIQYNNLKRQLESEQSSKQNSITQYNTLKRQYDSEKSSKENTITQYNNLKSQLESEQSSKEISLIQYNTLKIKYDSAKSSEKNTITQLNNLKIQLESEIMQYSTLKRRYDSEKSSKQNSITQYNTLKRQYDSEKLSKENAITQYDILKGQLESKESLQLNTIECLNSLKNQLQYKTSSTFHSIGSTGLKNAMSSLKEQINISITDHSEEKLKFCNEKKAVEYELENLKIKHNDFQKRAAESIKNWKEKVVHSENKVLKQESDLQSVVATHTNEKETYLKSNDDLNIKLKESTNKIACQLDEISKLNNNKFVLQNIINQLQSKVDTQLDKERNAQNKSTQTLIEDDKAKEARIEKLQEDLECEKKLFKSLSQEMNIARDQKNRIEEELIIQQKDVENCMNREKEKEEKIIQLKIENVGLKELNNSVSRELCITKDLLASKEQMCFQFGVEKKDITAANEVILDEKLTIINEMEEKLGIAEKDKINSSKLITGLKFELSESFTEKEEIRSLYTETIRELEEKLNSLKEENKCLKNDLDCMLNNKESIQQELRVFKEADINSKSELLKIKSSLESSDQLISEQRAQLELLEQDNQNNKDCLTKMDSLRSQIEKARQKLANVKIKRIKRNVDIKNINDLTNTLKTYKEKVSILEKKVENMQETDKIKINKSDENIQLESIKEILNEERQKAECILTEKEDLIVKFEKIKYELETLEKKSEETRQFDEDTIKNLKEKIKLKDEEIKLLTDKVDKYWPQRVENLNLRITLKSEILAAQTCGSENIDDNERMVMPSSCTSNPPNQNQFFELNEKLAENEDYIKSLKTVLNAKDEEITKLKLKVINNDDSIHSDITSSSGKVTQGNEDVSRDSASISRKDKPSRKRTHDNTQSQVQKQEIKKKKIS